MRWRSRRSAEPGEEDGLVEDGGGPGARLPHQVGGHGRFRFAQAGRVAQNLHGAVRLPDIGRRVAEGPGIERVAPAAHQGHGPERPGDEILMPLFRRNGPIGGAGLLHDVPQEGHAVLRLRREVREPLIREPGKPGGIALVVHDGRGAGKDRGVDDPGPVARDAADVLVGLVRVTRPADPIQNREHRCSAPRQTVSGTP